MKIHNVPDDWNPDHRCCLECGNTEPQVQLRALTHPVTNQQALACSRHISPVAAILNSYAPAPHTAAEETPKSATSPAPTPRHRPRT